ncbi:hypothetical protein [Zavarzinella formosa]|uniref:hypothetical protein n=1 Tax=Zavarzinella formosa TaxID=360055 RepID=UPI0012FB6E7B|nr:hypothetical protein [Zavarzinella formosa]
MAVGMNLLGRNVRCPHCKAVVQAPTAPGEPMSTPALVRAPVKPPEPTPTAPAPAPANLPQFNLPPKETEAPESIFGEVHDEDVFGSEPPKPTMPPPPIPAQPPETQTPSPMSVPAPVYSAPAPVYAAPQPQPTYDPNGATVAMPPPDNYVGDTETVDSPPPDDLAPPPQTRSEREPRRTQRPPTADEGKGSNAFAIILLAYGLLMTIAAGVFGYLNFVKSSEPEHPFKAIPDVFGEYEKANRKQTSLKWMPNAKSEVPNDLKVKLGDELVVGDLAVTPLEIKKELITAVEVFNAGDDRVRPVGPKTLVLSLKVKNKSSDVTFYPTDPAFVRKLPSGGDERVGPLTALQINNEMYYGPFPWPETGNTKKEFIQGQEANEKPLKPGEESTIFITVAPRQEAVRNLERVPVDQTLLWRVQLRRGLVKFKDDSTGKEGEFSATTVIGVTFKKTQIQ